MAKTHHYIGYKYGRVVSVYCDWFGGWQPLSGVHYRYKDDAEWEVARHQSAHPRCNEYGWIYRVLWAHYRCYRVMCQIGLGEYVWV